MRKPRWMLKSQNKIDIVMIPNKLAAEAEADVLAGQEGIVGGQFRWHLESEAEGIAALAAYI